jgi:AMP phosphorylase
MKLKANVLDISAEGTYVALLHFDDAATLSIKPMDRISIKFGSKKIVAVADVSLSEKNVKLGEIGLFRELAEELGITKFGYVSVKFEKEPDSLLLIKKKLDGNKLTKDEINEIIKDLLTNVLTEIEAAYFVSACYVHGLDEEETIALTSAIINNGGRLHFDKEPVLDKHSVGGVPGNRTTMIIVPIIAATGYTIPKTSTKSITSPAGTANTMSVLAPVEFTNDEIVKIVNKTNGCMVWGGTKGLASVDDKIIKFERPLSLDSEGFLLSSILAKKCAAGSTHVLIDIPVGKEAKIKNFDGAKKLSYMFVKLGKKFGLKIKVIISDGSQPVGNGVGPSLEARDVLLTLQNRGSKDLKEKSLYMAGLMLEMVGVKNGYGVAKDILESGKAYSKMKEIIRVQGGDPNIQPEDIKLGKFVYSLKSNRTGRIVELRNGLISAFAKMCGAPTIKEAGLYIYHKVGEKVRKGDVLITFYSGDKDRLNHVIDLLKEENIVIVK